MTSRQVRPPRRRASTAPAIDSPPIDPAKLGAALDDLGADSLRGLLDDALRSLSEAARLELLGRHVDLGRLRPDPPGSLLVDVRAFDAAVRSGEYYDGFNVNSKNYMEKSRGTRRFIAECNRLLGRCVKSGTGPQPAETRQAFELVFDLLRRIDEGGDDVFFADEAGAWQVGVDWEEVLPPWFACLARTASPDEFAQAVARVVEGFDAHASRKHHVAARRVATAAQRNALAKAIRDVQRETE